MKKPSADDIRWYINWLALMLVLFGYILQQHENHVALIKVRQATAPNATSTP